MKIFIFAYDRFTTMTTSEFFKSQAHTVLCHTDEHATAFRAGGRVHTASLVPTYKPKGLAYNRNVALDMMERGEWAVFFVDDLIAMTYLEGYETEHRALTKLPITPGTAKLWAGRFGKSLSASTFMELAAQEAARADAERLALVGFSLTNNALFRANKYSRWGLADGRCWLVKKTRMRFDENVQLIDDTCWTAKNLQAFGGVLINNWVLPSCARFSPGAFGSIQNRMPQKIAEAAYLVNNYGGFVAYADKAGWPARSHVRIRPKPRPQAMPGHR